MSWTSLPPSPVHKAFPGIQWDPLDKLILSGADKSLLQSAEANPVEYTLADPDDAAAYCRLLLKILDQVTGPSFSSSFVSQFALDSTPLPDQEALQMLYTDKLGVVTHYIITKLYEVVVLLKDAKPTATIQLLTTFYSDGILLGDWRPLLRLLYMGGTGDAFAQRGAALCLAYILLAGCPSQLPPKYKNVGVGINTVAEPLQALINWLTSRLQSSLVTSLGVVTPTLVVLSTCHEARIVLDRAGGIGYMSRHLRAVRTYNNRRVETVRSPSPTLRRNQSGYGSNNLSSKGSSSNASASVQQLYELCFCLWTMTYECETHLDIRQHFHRDGAVKALVQLVASAPREKVVRLALSALVNLAACEKNRGSKIGGSTFLTEMIGCNLMKSIDLLKERHWSDPDIAQDLDVLNKLLHQNFREMTRWEVYRAEVECGRLEWGIVHTETFFKENARLMEGPNGDFYFVKKLVKLVASHDEQVAAIACFDLGEFVRHYPNGKMVAKRLGAKDLVMHMIEHENAELRRHALQCVSKMLVQNWQYVSNS